MAIKDDEQGRMTKTVRERIEGSVANSDENERPENERPEGGGPTAEDREWLANDLSQLSEWEPYEWAEGELEYARPVGYQPGVGFVVRLLRP